MGFVFMMLLLDERQTNPERCLLSRSISVEIETASVCPNNLARYEKSEPRAWGCVLAVGTAEKAFENPVSLFRADRWTLVRDAHMSASVLHVQPHCYRGFGNRILARIVQKLTDGQAQQLDIGYNLRSFTIGGYRDP